MAMKPEAPVMLDALNAAQYKPLAEASLPVSPGELRPQEDRFPQQRRMNQGAQTVVIGGLKQRLRRARDTGFISARQQKKRVKAARRAQRGGE